MKKKNLVPIAWRSTQLNGVARPMLAAETLALTDACDIAFNISSVINIVMNKKITIKHSPRINYYMTPSKLQNLLLLDDSE